MTGHPVPANHSHWWLTTLPAWARLHAIPAGAWPGTEAVWEAGTEDAEYGAYATVAACGLAARFTYPGLFSRFSLDRCARCCAALGIPGGRGTPCNEAASVAAINP